MATKKISRCFTWGHNRVMAKLVLLFSITMKTRPIFEVSVRPCTIGSPGLSSLTKGKCEISPSWLSPQGEWEQPIPQGTWGMEVASVGSRFLERSKSVQGWEETQSWMSAGWVSIRPNRKWLLEGKAPTGDTGSHSNGKYLGEGEGTQCHQNICPMRAANAVFASDVLPDFKIMSCTQ
jgi:hypothetical protein